MERQVIGRRQALRTVGIAASGVALTTAAISATAHADDDHDNDDDDNGHRRKITGSWMVTAVGDGDPAPTILVASFAGGGVAISHEIKPAGPPFTGTWAQKGSGFQATFWSGFPGEGPGSPGPTAKLHVDGTLRGDGTIAGTFTVTVFDPVSGDPAQSFSGTFTGERIHAGD